MLKIKDNVDLKELEKFGFVMTFNPNRRFYYRDMLNHWPDDRIKVLVDTDTRLLTIEYELRHGGKSWTSSLDGIFDLISAGLVEKV